MTLEMLEEYKSNKPLFATIKKLRNEIETQKFWNENEEKRMWGEAADDIEKVWIEIGYGKYFHNDKNPAAELKEMIMDIFANPDEYIKELKTLRSSYDRKNEATESGDTMLEG